MPRRAHIAMIGIPAVSHVMPSLEIIRELVARGHRVSYANDPAMAETITATGAELVPYTSTLPVADDAWPEDPIAAMDTFADDAIAMLPQVRAAYDDDRPDLFLYDIAGYPARILAENWGRPAVQLSPSYVAWGDYEEEVGAMLKALPGADAHYGKLSAWLSDNGVENTDALSFTGRPPRSLALIPRAMQPKADTVDSDIVTFVGPCFGGRSDQGDWPRPAHADKVLLVSLGSAFTNQPGFYRECLSAFGDLPGWHVVLQVGAHVDPAELGTIPGNVEVHSWVPQLAILAKADLFVTHAGMGGSSEGLYCGVPMIAVPQAVDQFDNADKLVELGVAQRIDTEKANAEVLRQALLDLTTDPQVSERLGTLRTELRAAGGTGRAADLIEALLP